MKGPMMDKLLKDLIQFFENYQGSEGGSQVAMEKPEMSDGASIEVMKIGKPEYEDEEKEKKGMC